MGRLFLAPMKNNLFKASRSDCELYALGFWAIDPSMHSLYLCLTHTQASMHRNMKQLFKNWKMPETSCRYVTKLIYKRTHPQVIIWWSISTKYCSYPISLILSMIWCPQVDKEKGKCKRIVLTFPGPVRRTGLSVIWPRRCWMVVKPATFLWLIVNTKLLTKACNH